jgi:hypothetical protein
VLVFLSSVAVLVVVTVLTRRAQREGEILGLIPRLRVDD